MRNFSRAFARHGHRHGAAYATIPTSDQRHLVTGLADTRDISGVSVRPRVHFMLQRPAGVPVFRGGIVVMDMELIRDHPQGERTAARPVPVK